MLLSRWNRRTNGFSFVSTSSRAWPVRATYKSNIETTEHSPPRPAETRTTALWSDQSVVKVWAGLITDPSTVIFVGAPMRTGVERVSVAGRESAVHKHRREKIWWPATRLKCPRREKFTTPLATRVKPPCATVWRGKRKSVSLTVVRHTST